MEHWIEVGSDLWWFVRWPLICVLWFVAGMISIDPMSDNFAFGFSIIVSIVFTVVVTNV